MSEDHAELRSRLFGYVTAGAEEDDLPSFAAALDEYVAAVPHAPAAPTDAERMAAAAGLLRHAADWVDQEDLPQTAEDTADFCDGACWATAEVRRVADQVTAGDPGLRPDGFTELAADLGLTDAERAMLRYAIGCAREDMDDRADEFTTEDEAALESLMRLAKEE